MNSVTLLLCLIAADPLGTAREHLNHGRYEEALDAFEEAKSGGADPVAVAMGLSRTRIETGRHDDATKAIANVLAAKPEDADLIGRRGELRLLSGAWKEALEDADAVLSMDASHPAAHWVRA